MSHCVHRVLVPYQPLTEAFMRRCPLLQQPTYPVRMVGCTTCSPRAQVPMFSARIYASGSLCTSTEVLVLGTKLLRH
jgi:hypothetical protein